jgi:predicted secreted protein
MEALGIEMLLKVQIGATMTPVAGLLTDELIVDSETIDVTNKGSQSWRTLISGGRRTVDISCEAFVLDDEAQAVLKQAYMDDAVLVCEMTDGIDLGVSGSFKIGQFDFSGGYDGAERLTLTLHSINASVDPGYVPPEPEPVGEAELWGFDSYTIGPPDSNLLVRVADRWFSPFTVT